MNKMSSIKSDYWTNADQLAAVKARLARDEAEKAAHEKAFPGVKCTWKDGMLNAQ